MNRARSAGVKRVQDRLRQQQVAEEAVQRQGCWHWVCSDPCTQIGNALNFYHFNQEYEYVLLAKLKVHWRFFQLHKHFSKLRLHHKEVSPKIIIHINQSTNLEAALHLLCHCAIQTGWQMLTHTANTQDVLFSAPGKVTRKSFAASIEHILYTPFWVCAFPRVSLFCAWRVDWRGLGGGQWPWLGPHLVETIFQSLLFLIVNCLSPCPLFALGQLQLEATQQEVEWEVLRRSLPHPTVPETLSVQSCLEFIHGPMSKLWSCVGCTRHNLRQDVSQAEFGSRVHWILLSLHMCHKFQSCRWNSRERERETGNITEFVFTRFDTGTKCFSDFQCGGLFKDLPHHVDLSHLHPFNCSDLKLLHTLGMSKVRGIRSYVRGHMCSWYLLIALVFCLRKSWPWRVCSTRLSSHHRLSMWFLGNSWERLRMPRLRTPWKTKSLPA